MSLSKLKRLHVIIIGSVACVAVAAGIYFLLIAPVNKQITDVSAMLSASVQVANRRADSIRQLDDARVKVSVTEAKLTRYQSTKMPNLSFAERDKGMIQLWHEQSETLGPILEAWANRGVRSNGGVSIPAPTSNPNELQPGMIKLDVGKVEVQGNFQAILRNIRGWNSCPRLVQIDRPSLSGTSPALTATYQMTVYIFPRSEPGPEIKMAGAGGAAAGAPGAAPPPAPVATAPPAGGGGGEGGGGAMRGMDGGS